MWKHLDYKVPSGKLLRIDADIQDNIIKDIRICGDFFIYPEDGISAIESSLKGQKLNDSDLNIRLGKATKNLQMIGLSAENIKSVLDKFIS